MEVCVPLVKKAKHAAFWLGATLGCVVIAVLALTLFFVLPPRTVTLHLTTPLHRTSLLAPQAHASQQPIRMTLPTQPDAGVDTLARGYLLVPAVYSQPDEGYVIRMRLGLDNVLVVLDSGSGNLSVGTADCVKASLCSAHDGAYRPDASPNAVNLERAANLQYASLAVNAQWWHDAAALPYVSERACRDTPPALEDVKDETTLPNLMPVAAAARMDGTASNILGLMGAHPSQGEAPVLEHMLASLRLPRRWALAAYANGSGYLVLGDFPSHCFPQVTLKHVPMSRSFSYMGAPCVDIQGMRWRDARTQQWASVPAGDYPKYAVLDTGTSLSYATQSASHFAQLARLPSYRDVVDAGVVDTLPDIEIALANGLRVVYGPKHYMVPSGSGVRNTICCGDGTVDSLFGAAPVFLVGIHHMSGWVLDVDLARQRVGFGRLPTK